MINNTFFTFVRDFFNHVGERVPKILNDSVLLHVFSVKNEDHKCKILFIHKHSQILRAQFSDRRLLAEILPIRRYNLIINQSINQSVDHELFPPLQSDSGVIRASGCAPVVSVSLIVSTAT